MSTTYDRAAVLFARASLSFFEYGSLKAYGVLVQEVTEQTQMSYKEVGLILPLQRSIAYILAPIASFLFNYLGARTSVTFGGLLVGLDYVGNGCLSLQPLGLILCCTCIGLGYGIAYTATYLCLKDTFSDNATFGVIQSLTDQFTFVGMIILPVLYDKFQDLYDKQGALLLFGGLNLDIMVTGMALRTKGCHTNDICQDKEQSTSDVNYNEEYYGDTGLVRHYWLVLVRNPDIRSLLSMSIFQFFNLIGLALFLVSLGEELGYTRSNAVLLSSCSGFGALFGRVWSMFLFSRMVHKPSFFFVIPASVQCLSLVGIVFTQDNFQLSMVVSFVSGMSFGAMGAAFGGVCPLKTSVSDFRPAIIMFFMVGAFGNELGGGIYGFVYDIFGWAINVFLLMAIASFMIILVSMCWAMWDVNKSSR